MSAGKGVLGSPAMASAATPSLPAAAAAPAKLSTAEGFAVGSAAAGSAVLFSNPAESVKTRMQLQGELLEKGGPKQVRLYKNAFDCFVKTAKTEGFAGVQRGLGAAVIYQVLLNGSRLGFYEPFRLAFNRAAGKDAKEVWAPGALAAGASSGIVGGEWGEREEGGDLNLRQDWQCRDSLMTAILGNPLFLIKARMQAYSPHHQIGKTSYKYKNTFDGLRSIVRTDGFGGLARGMDAAILRTAMGSTVQLPAYNWAKTYLVNLKSENTLAYNPFLLFAEKPNSFWTYLISSTFSGLCVCAVMQPADTALSRVYNQPTVIDGEYFGRARIGESRHILTSSPL
jgi:solute carrier family 25 protein 34/35